MVESLQSACMDFSEEKRKPMYAVRGMPRLRSLGEQRQFQVLANEGLLEQAGGGIIMIKAAALDALPQLLTEGGLAGDPDTERRLISARLKAVPEKLFRFLDGAEVTGSQAAREVEQQTGRGRYFLRLERATLKLAREAKQRGEF